MSCDPFKPLADVYLEVKVRLKPRALFNKMSKTYEKVFLIFNAYGVWLVGSEALFGNEIVC